MKKYLSGLIIFLFFVSTKGFAFEIDAAKNASIHNNRGVDYLLEANYSSAIKEFEIAIQLNPNTQASSVYYNNLGKVYMKLGHAHLAEKSFKEALKRNNMNFEYYHNIVLSFKSQNKLQSELKRYMLDKKPNAPVFVGLILIESGKLEAGINMLDEYCFDHPDMILTKGVKTYIQSVAPKQFRF